MSARTGRPVEEIYEDEVSAVVVHGDEIDQLQGWQWDQSKRKKKSIMIRARTLNGQLTQMTSFLKR